MRAPFAVSPSLHNAARTPGALLATIEQPVPVQHSTIASSASPLRTAPDRLQCYLRPICRILFCLGSKVQWFMSSLHEFLKQGFDERQPFVGTDRNTHEIQETDYEYRYQSMGHETKRQTQPDTSCSLVNQWYGD